MIAALDGEGAAARFNSPTDVATDAEGNIYVVEPFNSLVRKVTPGGVVTTLAGAAGQVGDADGAGSAARFGSPSGVVVDAAGNVYVADSEKATIRKVSHDGEVSTLAGTSGAAGILLGAAPRFSRPSSLAIVGDSLVIADINAILVLRHAVH
ncbi:MAG TPA: hypothetical protein VF713_05320 [Thermoanaerobaculia bacterium]